MSPLSTLKFIKNNKRHTFSSALAIVTAIVFLFIFECFIESMMQSAYYATASVLERQIEISPAGSKTLNENIISGVKSSADIEKIIPALTQETAFNIFGAGGTTQVYGLRSSDVSYFLRQHGSKLKEGRLPISKDEIAIDMHVSKNRKLKIGDSMGNKVDKLDSLAGKYTVVGILEGIDCVSITSDPFTDLKNVDENTILENGLIAFPKPGRLEAAGNDLKQYSNEDVNVYTLSWMNSIFDDSVESIKVMDTIAIIAIIVMAVCLVCSKYAQFYNRKAEFGILYAMGFSRKSIMLRALREVMMVNLGSFIIGLSLGILSCVFIIGDLYSKSGGLPVFICEKAVVLSIIAPLFTTLFTLIPVFRMLSSVDPVTVIEAN
jgi:ABC-type lipoprotein release transport system permease subunit